MADAKLGVQSLATSLAKLLRPCSDLLGSVDDDAVLREGLHPKVVIEELDRAGSGNSADQPTVPGAQAQTAAQQDAAAEQSSQEAEVAPEVKAANMATARRLVDADFCLNAE